MPENRIRVVLFTRYFSTGLSARRLIQHELVYAPVGAPQEFVIDELNGNPTAPIPLETVSSEEVDGELVVQTRVGIKTLAKRFAKGINRFDVSYELDGERVATEVVLNIQF